MSERKAIFIFGRGCPHCEETMNTELFKNISDVVDVVFDEEAFVFGADYANASDVVERRYGFQTPSLIINPVHGDPTIFDNSLSSYAYVYRYLGIKLRGRKRKSSKTTAVETEKETKRRSRRSRKKEEFVETKELKKEILSALKGCEEEVCREE